MAAPDDAPRGLRLATVGSVPVYLGWSWLVLAGLVLLLLGPDLAARYGPLGYLLAALYALGILVCVLAHEGAHAWVARRHGHPVHRVVADLWGGHTAFDASRGTPRSAALIALAGPAANLAVAALAAAGGLLAPEGSLATTALRVLLLANLVLAGFNLLPALPLDGGQVLEAVVWRLTGDQGRGRVVAGWCGRVLVLVILGLLAARMVLTGERPDPFGLIWTVMIAAFLWTGASAAIAGGQVLRRLGAIDLSQVVEPAATVPATAPVTVLLDARAVPVVVGPDGAPVGLVDHLAVRAVPADLVTTTPVAAVTRHPQPGWVVEMTGAAPALGLVRAFQASGSDLVVVTDAGRVRGVVRSTRLHAALAQA